MVVVLVFDIVSRVSSLRNLPFGSALLSKFVMSCLCIVGVLNHMVYVWGGKGYPQHAGRYTKEIAQAIHRGYVRVLKRKDPGRIIGRF